MAETSASIAESFLYVYLGFSVLSIDPTQVKPFLILLVGLGVVVSRLIGVFFPYYLLKMLSR